MLPRAREFENEFRSDVAYSSEQLGDAHATNVAIKIELEATEEHLYKAWHSKDYYYRSKYPKWKRAVAFWNWLKFKFLDWIWGNGESALKLLYAVLAVLALIAVRDVFLRRDPSQLLDYFAAAVDAPQIFLGTLVPSGYSAGYLAVIVFFRLVAFAFLMSIVIKRFSRR